ncbi:hypothetical protein [Xenorhabdus szentirmaii]|uniref:hypothetical protein n=1 Tax=Xenorhabdus szentirmaii TaxID=290112 RepID=UPI000571AFD3|nr:MULTISPECIES: hypothetical protein [Xenorhabdus]MBD2780765.1 hypothetical protein [Xenorhabdus sp. 38]
MISIQSTDGVFTLLPHAQLVFCKRSWLSTNTEVKKPGSKRGKTEVNTCRRSSYSSIGGSLKPTGHGVSIRWIT